MVDVASARAANFAWPWRFRCSRLRPKRTFGLTFSLYHTRIITRQTDESNNLGRFPTHNLVFLCILVSIKTDYFAFTIRTLAGIVLAGT